MGGFEVSARVKAGDYDGAEKSLENLAAVNRLGVDGGEWEFREWIHGETVKNGEIGKPMRKEEEGKPVGNSYQAWSASSFLYGFETVERRSTIFFDDVPDTGHS